MDIAVKASLGQLPNAPLALVLAQVVFSKDLGMADRIPTIQSAVRKDYPAYDNQKVYAFEIGPSGLKTQEVDRWQFSDPEHREGILVLQDALIFNATKYADYDSFSTKLLEVLRTFERIAPGLLVQRLGLRYVDIIVPSRTEEPEEFVVSGLHALELRELGATSITSMHFSELKMAEGVLHVRYRRGMSEPFMPDDLQPFMLAPAPIVDRAKDAVARGATVACLDFDRIVKGLSLRFVADDIQERFFHLHEDHSRAFKSLQTPHARKVWAESPQ